MVNKDQRGRPETTKKAVAVVTHKLISLWQKSEKERQTEKLFNRLSDLIENGREEEFKDDSKISNLISFSHTEQMKNQGLS